jgi:hypothetical protein
MEMARCTSGSSLIVAAGDEALLSDIYMGWRINNTRRDYGMFEEDDENHGYGRVESGEAAAEKQGSKGR